MISCEILCLGNELLIGRTINKNATDIALSMTKIGVKVTRTTTIRDEIKSGVDVVREILERSPDILCITGGLGPTHDDIQLEIVANAVNQKLIINNEALSMLILRYGGDESKLTSSRRKMCQIPEKGRPLQNREGSAPGVYLIENNTHIFSLPGVPREMRSILENEIIPIVLNQFDLSLRMVEYGFDVRGIPEADITPIMERIMSKHNPVNLKSHPRKDESGYWLSLHCYFITDNDNQVLNAAIDWKKLIELEFPNAACSEIIPIFSDNFIPE